jgi:hypothetical protein
MIRTSMHGFPKIIRGGFWDHGNLITLLLDGFGDRGCFGIASQLRQTKQSCKDYQGTGHESPTRKVTNDTQDVLSQTDRGDQFSVLDSPFLD